MHCCFGPSRRRYEKHVGRKTTHRVTNTQNWGFHESEEENLIIHFRAVSSVKGIFWNGAQKKPWKLFAFEPDLVEYIAFSLDFMATSGLYGILIAMHRCARVDLYGFQVSTEHGTLYHYYDVCGALRAPQNAVRSVHTPIRAGNPWNVCQPIALGCVSLCCFRPQSAKCPRRRATSQQRIQDDAWRSHS